MTDQQVIAHHAALIAELRSEARALYASQVATVARLRDLKESVEGSETLIAKSRAALVRLGALDDVADKQEAKVVRGAYRTRRDP